MACNDRPLNRAQTDSGAVVVEVVTVGKLRNESARRKTHAQPAVAGLFTATTLKHLRAEAASDLEGRATVRMCPLTGGHQEYSCKVDLFGPGLAERFDAVAASVPKSWKEAARQEARPALFNLAYQVYRAQPGPPTRAKHQSQPRPVAGPIYRSLATVQPEEVRWLSPGRIPLGKLTVLEGDPGLGKTTVLLDLAARLSRGEGWPGDPALQPANAVIITGEDGVGDTVVPRLAAAGAQLDRIYVHDGQRLASGEAVPFVIPRGLGALQETIERKAARLVIIDVLNAFLSGEFDSYRDHDIRRALLPLQQLAEATDAAIVVVRHLRKGGARAITAGAGSIGIAAAARSVLLVAQDPADPARRVLASVKSNLAAPPVSLSFSLETGKGSASRVQWYGESSETADSLQVARAALEPVASRERDKVHEMADLLRGWLEDAGGDGLDRREVLQRARAAGFSESTLDRAARRLGVVRHVAGFGDSKRSVWALPLPRGIPVAPIDAGADGIESPDGDAVSQGLSRARSRPVSQSNQADGTDGHEGEAVA